MTFRLAIELLVAVLAASSSSIVYASSSSTSSPDDLNLIDVLTKLSPTEFVQTKQSPQDILSSTFPTAQLHDVFTTWSIQFNKSYNTLEEHALRKVIWLQNHLYITNHNTQGGKHSHILGHNDFSDLTNDEFQQRFYLGKYSPGIKKPKGRNDGKWPYSSSSTARKLLRNSEDEDQGVVYYEGEEEEVLYNGEDDNDEVTVVNVPEYKNWNEDGAVTSVKNQWFCGACWAFSAIGSIEGARYIKTGNLTDLSMQQLLDCDMTDLGCFGGLMDQAFQYDEDAVGLCSAQDYPYAYHRHWFWGCERYAPYCSPLPYTKVKKYVNVTKTEEALTAAIATQPVSVAVAAGGTNWQFYKGGVYDVGCEHNEKGEPAIDHGVLAVGYGHYDPTTDPSPTAGGGVASDYFLIKNSWGENWGMNGFIQLGRNTGHEAEGGSSCVLSLASRPILLVED